MATVLLLWGQLLYVPVHPLGSVCLEVCMAGLQCVVTIWCGLCLNLDMALFYMLYYSTVLCCGLFYQVILIKIGF